MIPDEEMEAVEQMPSLESAEQFLRERALDFAMRKPISTVPTAEELVRDAKVFEAYLRGSNQA